jgi:hypothetical protein
MGFLDKAKAAAEQAAAKAKEGVEDVQLKRELGQAYGDLGRIAYGLIESGELSHSALEAPAAKVRTLNEKAAASDGEPVGAAAGAASEPYDSDQPPAMPT